MKQHKISGVIGWDATAAALDLFLKEANGDDIELTISSPGGLVGEALEMFNAVRAYPGKTRAILSGYAMSAASYIPMAADEVVVEDNAVMMIHNAQGMVWGDHNEMLKYGNILKGLSALLGQAYSKFTGKNKDEVAALMDAETYLFGNEIVMAGFANSSVAVDDNDEDDKPGKTAEARLAFGGMVAKLGSDKTMFYNDLSRAATALGATGAKPKITKEEELMDLMELKSKYPDLCTAIATEATAEMGKQLEAAKAEGATAENQRIKDVKAQLVPGHEALIESLAYDGKSTAADAALAIVAAEIKLRATAAESFASGAPAVVPPVNNEDLGAIDKNAPIEQRAEAEWKKSGDLRAEFRENYASYLAYRKAEESGQAKVFGKK